MWKIYNKLLKIFTLGFVGVLSIACLTACGESRTPEKANEPLSAPSGLKADFWEFSWQEVENATGYVVSVLEEEYETTETSFELFEYLAPNDLVTLQVKAKGNGVETLDSEWSALEYEAESVTKKLNYNLLPDGTYEVYCKEDEVPKNGELVLPDTYLGRDVTVFSPREKSLFEPDFPEYGGVVAVRLPARVKKITDGALYRSQIEKIYIPKTAESVDGFTGCKKLAPAANHREVRHPKASSTPRKIKNDTSHPTDNICTFSFLRADMAKSPLLMLSPPGRCSFFSVWLSQT